MFASMAAESTWLRGPLTVFDCLPESCKLNAYASADSVSVKSDLKLGGKAAGLGFWSAPELSLEAAR